MRAFSGPDKTNAAVGIDYIKKEKKNESILWHDHQLYHMTDQGFLFTAYSSSSSRE